MDLKIEYVPLGSIKPYKRNAKKHPPEQVEQIKRSITSTLGMKIRNTPLPLMKEDM